MRTVVDVRDGAGPAPQWQKEPDSPMRVALREAGIRYTDAGRTLGNPWSIRSAAQQHRQPLEYMRTAFARHLRTDERARAGMRSLCDVLAYGDEAGYEPPLCLLCACADAAECHRGVIVDELVAGRALRPGDVVHIPGAAPRRKAAALAAAQGRLL